MRIPGRIALASATFLIALGIPFFSIEFTSVDAQVLPADASARQVDNVLRAEFPPYRDTPIQLAVERRPRRGRGRRRRAPPRSTASPRSTRRSASTRRPLGRPGDLGGPAARPVEPGPRRARCGNSPATRSSTGFTAGYVDLQDSLVEHLPLVLALVAAATFIVLFLMTGSVILPLKQLVMNLLGLSAVFGILVLIFQDGRFESLLGYTSQGGLESTQPLLLFAVAFGLSTDYGVFLLSRIKEARDAGASRLRGGRDRARAHRADRDRSGAPVLHRDRRVRDLGDHLHQAARARHGDRRPDRRDDHPRAARARR